jgi:tripartite-type tricarboxylate transporter receptor subunit TctC
VKSFEVLRYLVERAVWSNAIVARLLAEEISRTQGTTLVVENRPGAATEIGAESVSRASPDGNTLLLATGALLFTPQMRTVKYHPLTGFEPICRLTTSPTLVLVSGASPYRTLADLFDTARARPGELTWASFGRAPRRRETPVEEDSTQRIVD